MGVLYCYVPDCHNSSISSDVTFHRLSPSPLSRYGQGFEQCQLKKWNDALTKDSSKPFVCKPRMLICSAHFDPSAFRIRGTQKYLHSFAVPTKLPWTPNSFDKYSTKISKKVGQCKVPEPECDSAIQETSLSLLASTVSQSSSSAVLIEAVPERENGIQENLEIETFTKEAKQMEPHGHVAKPVIEDIAIKKLYGIQRFTKEAKQMEPLVAKPVVEGIFPDLNFCLVNGCFNTNNIPNVTLHSVPEKNSLRYRKWVGILQIGKRKACLSLPGNYICSVHFDESSFVICDGEKKLTADSVPSIFPWNHYDLKMFGSQQNIAMTQENTYNPRTHDDNVNIKCGNCNCWLNNDIPPVRLFECTDRTTNETYDVHISDAISYVYGIGWKEFSKTVSKPDVMLGRLSETARDETNVSLPLDFCNQCASSLQAAYVAYKDFEQLTKPESIIYSAKLFQQQQRRSTEVYNDVKTEEDCDRLFDYFNCDNTGFPFPSVDDLDVKCKVEIEEMDEKITMTDSDYPTIIPMECVPNEFDKDTTDDLNCDVQTAFYICEQCDETFTCKDVWISHKRLYHEKISSSTPFYCHVCRKSCKSFIQFKYLHLPSHQNAKSQMKCKYCGKHVKNRKSLTGHLEKTHNEKQKLRIGRTCEVCKKIIYAKGEKIMEAHMKTHAEVASPCTCTACYKKFTTAAELQTHMLSHPQLLKIISCPLCPEMFPSVQDMRFHKEIHKEKVPLFCKICKRPFYFKDALMIHELLHLKEKTFKCDKCNASFHRKHYLKRHQSVRHSEGHEAVCHLCGVTYKNNIYLQYHLKMHEEKEQNLEYKCDECGLILANKQRLANHKLNRHFRPYVFKCSICGQALNDAGMLKRHEQYHKTNPNFKGRPRKPKCLQKVENSVNTVELSVDDGDEDESTEEEKISVQGCSGPTRRFITYPGRKKDKACK